MALRRLLPCFALALAVGPAAAQDSRFEAGPHLFAADQLSQSGDPLSRQLFTNGWPTTQSYLDMVTEQTAQPARAIVQSFLSSGAGLPLHQSHYESQRLDRVIQNGIDITSPEQLLAREIIVYRSITGCEASIPASYNPVFIPRHRGRAELLRRYDPNNLATWAFRDESDPVFHLEDLGFSLLANARYARTELSHVRNVEQAGRSVELIGRTGLDGFFGLLSLHTAIAQLHELRHLLLDDRTLGDITHQRDLLNLDELRYFYAPMWTSAGQATATHELAEGTDNRKSHLRGQAAVLLGLCQLAQITRDDAPSELKDLFNERELSEGVYAFERDLFDTVAETALFTFNSMRALHVDLRNEGRASSLSRGATISPTDLGLFLMALESFCRVQYTGRNAERGAFNAQLREAHTKARRMAQDLAAMLVTWQQRDGGLFAIYATGPMTPQLRAQPIDDQALAILGLIAAHRLDPNNERYLTHARSLTAWLDRHAWDLPARSFLQPDSNEDRRELSPFGAAATLAALRELALATGDGRLIERHRDFLRTLHQNQFTLDPDGSQPAAFNFRITIRPGS